MAGKLNRTTLFEAAVAAIKQNILSGEWPPGSRLPSERELIQQFGISRSPLREALKALHAMGLLDIRHGEGIFVNQLPEPVQSRKEFLTLFDGVTAFHVLDIRRILELESVRRAARRGSPEDLQRLQQVYQTMVELQNDVHRFREADLQFHILLAEMAGNPLLARIVRELRSLFLQQMQRDMMVEEALADHKAILEAVQSRSVRRAEQAMNRHFQRMYDYYLQDSPSEGRAWEQSGDWTRQPAAEPKNPGTAKPSRSS